MRRAVAAELAQEGAGEAKVLILPADLKKPLKRCWGNRRLMWNTRPRVSWHRVSWPPGNLCHRTFLVPKLLLGNPLWRNDHFAK